MEPEETLVALEGGFWETDPDPDHFRRHVDDRAVFVFPGGFGVLGKEEVVARLGSAGPGWSDHRLEDVRVVAITEDTAILVYLATARQDDGEPYRAQVASAYARRGGTWRLAFHQQTPLEGRWGR